MSSYLLCLVAKDVVQDIDSYYPITHKWLVLGNSEFLELLNIIWG